LTPIGVRDPSEIESGVTEFVRSPNGGLIVTAGGPVIVHRAHIVATAARHRLPTVYWNRMYVAGGGGLIDCPLVALSGHPNGAEQCPLSRANRTGAPAKANMRTSTITAL
jgi:hypothetical protein